MHRRSVVSLMPVASAIGLTLFAAACAGQGEQQALKKYFDASRLRDSTTLGNIAVVRFDPSEQGIVQGFNLVSVSDERSRPLKHRELRKAYDEAKAADDEFSKRKKAYQDGNMEAIARVLRSERENQKLKGPDAAVQAEWTKWRSETAEVSKRLSEARRSMAEEREVAELSVFDALRPINLDDYEGEIISKDVTVDAKVRPPNANDVQNKRLVVTLTRADVRGSAGSRTGRWIVTGIK